MKRFEHLIRPFKIRRVAVSDNSAFGAEVVAHQRHAEAELPRLVHESGFRIWKPGGPVPEQGPRVLIGVSAGSRYDLQFLDTLAEAMARGSVGNDQIDVFQYWLECQTQEQLDQFIPGMDIRTIFHSPVVGIWEDGGLVNSSSGALGRDLIAQRYGLSIAG